MNVDLHDRHVLVMGADSPIRRAIEAALAASGAVVGEVSGERAFGLVAVSMGASGFEAGGEEFAEFEARIRALAPTLQRAVIVMSAAALVPVRGLAAFSAAQSTLERLTRSLAMEEGPRLRVNGVAVGPLEGNDESRRMIGHSALGRAARLGEVSAAVLFLLDPANGYMTGHTLAVDGGWAAGYARNF